MLFWLCHQGPEAHVKFPAHLSQGSGCDLYILSQTCLFCLGSSLYLVFVLFFNFCLCELTQILSGENEAGYKVKIQAVSDFVSA